MRVLVVFLIGALTCAAFSNADAEANPAESKIVGVKPAELEAPFFWPFKKKKKGKKIKGSNRLKKQNRRIGKKFKRQNDDTLRR